MEERRKKFQHLLSDLEKLDVYLLIVEMEKLK